MYKTGKIAAVFFAAGLILTSCGETGDGSISTGSYENRTVVTAVTEITGITQKRNRSTGVSAMQILRTEPDEAKIESAKTVYEIKDHLTKTSSYLKYSECENDADLLFYFDLLNDKEYITVEKDGETYLLFNYIFVGYGKRMKDLKAFEKKYEDGTFVLSTCKEICDRRAEGDIGCEPDQTCCRCILRGGRDFEKLTVDDEVFNAYDGGQVRAGNKVGIADRELNIILPVKYDSIRDFPLNNYRSEKINSAHTYKIIDSSCGKGLIDENCNIVLQPEYLAVVYINDDRFMVCRSDEPLNIHTSKMGIIDSKGNVIREFTDGLIHGSQTCVQHNYAEQVLFSIRKDNDFFMGVMDKDMNVIIPPVYKKITSFRKDTGNMFYVVSNTDGETAVFDIRGHRETDFVNDDVYDVQTAYARSKGLI